MILPPELNNSAKTTVTQNRRAEQYRKSAVSVLGSVGVGGNGLQRLSAILEILPFGEVASVLIYAIFIGKTYPLKTVSFLNLVKKIHNNIGGRI